MKSLFKLFMEFQVGLYRRIGCFDGESGCLADPVAPQPLSDWLRV
jgi:hypothetical protein